MAEVKERLAEPLISVNLSIRSNVKLRAAFRLALSYRRHAQGDILPCRSVPLFLFVLLNGHLGFDKLDGCSSLGPSRAEKRTLCNRSLKSRSGCPSGEVKGTKIVAEVL